MRQAPPIARRAPVPLRLGAILCGLVLACAAAPAFAEIAPIAAGTVIEWREPALTRAKRSDDWLRQRIVAVEGNVVRYWEDDQGNEVHSSEIRHESYRGLVPLLFQVEQFDPQNRDDRSRTIQRFRVAEAALAALSPLEIGKRVRLKVTVDEEIYLDLRRQPETSRFALGDRDIAVERQETIDVPAGRFDTFVVLIERIFEHERALPQDSPRRERRAERVWYAPALGWPVKRDEGRIGPAGFAARASWHVIEIRRP